MNRGEEFLGLLAADSELDFLLQLNEIEIETLVVCIRGRVEQGGNEL